MSHENTNPLSIAEVCELASGAWINDGFTARVKSIDQKTAGKTGRKFWVCILQDTTGGATVECSVFTVPKFNPGDTIMVTGQGIKFEDGQYGKKVKAGDKAIFNVTDRGAAGPAGRTEPRQQDRPAPQAGDDRRGAGQTGSDAPDPGHSPAVGHIATIHGATVGMAMNQAMEHFRYVYTPDQLRDMAKTVAFQAGFAELASDFIRIALMLEKGKLSPSIRERLNPPQKRDELPPRQSLQGRGRSLTPEQEANLTGGEQDVPF